MTEYSVAKIKEQLEEPFDPELLYWKPQATNKEKTRAMVAVYADPRAYIERLNTVCGIGGWSDSANFTVVPHSSGTAPDGKIIATVSITIHDLKATHTETGESDTSDPNAATSAIAQAFKRACVKFGLGKYLYDFPKNQWVAYDAKTKKVVSPPAIPDWALPAKTCQDCSERISSYTYPVGQDDEGNPIDRTLTVSEIIGNSKKKYDKDLCVSCQKDRATKGKEAAGSRLTPTVFVQPTANSVIG